MIDFPRDEPPAPPPYLPPLWLILFALWLVNVSIFWYRGESITMIGSLSGLSAATGFCAGLWVQYRLHVRYDYHYRNQRR